MAIVERKQEEDMVSMTTDMAALVLRQYNQWMCSEHAPSSPPYTSEEISHAIDYAVRILEQGKPKVDIDGIISIVAKETGVVEEEMIKKGRHREYTEARAIVSWLAYHYTTMTLTSIGCRLGRDHATAIHYNHMVDGWLDDPRRNPRGARITKRLIQEIGYDNQKSNRSTY